MTARADSRRVCLVGGAFVLMTMILWARLVHVQYFQRERYRAVARNQMMVAEDVPSIRGFIFDRNGRALAMGVRLHSISLSPDEVTNPRRVAAELQNELDISSGQVNRALRSGKRFVWLERQRLLTDEAIERLSALKGVGIHMEPGRIYPYGSVANEIVGFVGVDNEGMTGIEAAFDFQLRGVFGRAHVLRNGKYTEDRYHRFIEKKPRNGNHVYLTVDVALQEIAETELARAVAANDATSGSIIVMEPHTGEILALAEYPSPESRSRSQRADSLWTLRTMSHVYEPGSTFKLVTAAALIDSRKVTAESTFDAEEGRANVGVTVIADPHPYGEITFAEAFALSSNIVMYKASKVLDDDEFYRYIRLFGFGEKTGMPLRGESAGNVRPVDDWSLRTKGTMAFGQEVAVTALQMITAFAVILNDGVLIAPRLVRGVVDGETGKAEETSPIEVRRVVSRSTAKTLRQFCTRAVVEGTGVLAQVDFMTVAGKTGTAQKASPRGGYLPGKYVASFIGYAPEEDPRILCLILLDEPRYDARFGGQSCAPVFASMCREMAEATDLFSGLLVGQKLETPRSKRVDSRAPNFLRMERSAALERGRDLGFNVLCTGEFGRVVSQQPGPGMPMDEDDVIRLAVADGDGWRGNAIPDFRGLAVREAEAKAEQLGFRCVLVGNGVVKTQNPEPGEQVRRRMLRLYCGAVGGQARGGSR